MLTPILGVGGIVALSVFLGLIYKKLYREHLEILNEMWPKERPLVGLVVLVNYSSKEMSKARKPWYVGCTLIEKRGGERYCSYNGDGAEPYFHENALYNKIVVPLLKGGSFSKIKAAFSSNKYQDVVTFYE